MEGTSIARLMVQLRDLICDAYSDAEFAELVFTHAPEFDYAGLPKQAYKLKVFETVLWANRFGAADHVLWLARLAAAKRPKREDLAKLADDIAAAIQPAVPQAAAPAAPAPQVLPTELATPLDLLATRQLSLPDLVLDLRPKLRAIVHGPYDLAGRFHLSELEGHRLVAVLALESAPDPAYLRWLSERVTVERPFMGHTAAQAMTAAALRLASADLDRARAASTDAADRLDELVEVDDQRVPDFDIAARKRQLQLALSLIDMRAGKGGALASGELDTFLTELLREFDRDGFERLCRRLDTSLKWFGRANDPIELIIVNMAVTARDRGWERDLVRAAYEERNNNATFAAIHQRCAAGLGSVA